MTKQPLAEQPLIAPKSPDFTLTDAWRNVALLLDMPEEAIGHEFRHFCNFHFSGLRTPTGWYVQWLKWCSTYPEGNTRWVVRPGHYMAPEVWDV